MSSTKAKQTMQLMRILNLVNAAGCDPLVQIGMLSIDADNLTLAWDIWDRMDIDTAKCSDKDFDVAAKQAIAEHFADQELTDVARDQSV